jgi:hypothetical protein
MFVLMQLMNLCLRRVYAPFFGANQSLALIHNAQAAINLIAASQTHTLAYIHPPTLRRTI